MGVKDAIRKFFTKKEDDEFGPETFPEMERPMPRRPVTQEKDDFAFPNPKDFEQRHYEGEPVLMRGAQPRPRQEMFRPQPAGGREDLEALRQILSKLDIIESRLKIIESKLEERRY